MDKLFWKYKLSYDYPMIIPNITDIAKDYPMIIPNITEIAKDYPMIIPNHY